MNVPHFRLAIALLAILLTGSATSEEFAPSAPAVLCDSTYRRPGFASVDDFVGRVSAPTGPWQRLLATVHLPDMGDETQAEHPFSKGVRIIYRSRTTALVFVHRKVFRTSPYCAVIFLLVKRGRQFHVADFIYRATDYESYSDIEVPSLLPLKSRRLLHFHLSEFFGGRRWGFDTDELFVVRHDRLRRTLRLRADGAYLFTPWPYLEFFQGAEVSVANGRPCVTISRSWTSKEGKERKEKFAVVFRWNSSTEKFESTSRRKITIKEPELWSAEGLPTPPPEQP